ncbi:hypothetical protein HY745_01755 [Candidatus Desantisbacteria bacterium]|nr:hypothetical protein [Candidatus Desantisbacteria bacterium]
MKKINFVVIAFIITSKIVYAQHEHHLTFKEDTTSINVETNMDMSHPYLLSLPMNRNGSGTSWIPDESPMYGYMLHLNKWLLMFHGSIFLRYTGTDITREGSKGAAKWDAPNWFMGMAQKQIKENGLLKFSLMMSLEKLTESGRGYPLLFQSGETWNGERLVDRQHPHDLFSELSGAYTQRINKNIDVICYFGYPGEPALGPTAFMHRASSSNNPDAPLSHHWQDASHITFGTGTLGVRYKMLKIEGSIFNGSEPDENRFDFDKAKFNSLSYRLSLNPTKNFAMQFSQGFLKSPEALEPDINVIRTTASVIHSYVFSSVKNINTTTSWGMNDKESGNIEHSFLLESDLKINKLNVYERYEFVQKDSEELNLAEFDTEKKFIITSLTIGANYKVFNIGNTDFSLGIQGNIYFTPSELRTIYGNRPLSAQVYLKINPSLMN